MKEKVEKNYEKKIHRILKTYNSILVKCQNLPMLSDKNIVMVEGMDGMINAQIETRKPILYFEEPKSIAFIILDGNEAYIYIVKESLAIQSKVERLLNNSKVARNIFVKEILSKIEQVLLNGNTGNEKLLTSSELDFLESIKEDSINNNLEELNNSDELKGNEENTKVEENSVPDALSLVPVKKKFWPFNRRKKARRSKDSKSVESNTKEIKFEDENKDLGILENTTLYTEKIKIEAEELNNDNNENRNEETKIDINKSEIENRDYIEAQKEELNSEIEELENKINAEENVNEESNITVIENESNTNLKEAEIKILDLIKKDDKCKIKNMVKITKFSEAYVNKIIRSLKNKQYIDRVGTNKNGQWKVLK